MRNGASNVQGDIGEAAPIRPCTVVRNAENSINGVNMTSIIQSYYSMESVRTNDPDRYILAMVAPASFRAGLFALYAFNVEIARTRELVSEPPLGEIRLQWWRDGIGAIYSGEGLHHGIGDALASAVSSYDLNRSHLDRLIDARSADLDDNPPESMAELLRYAEETTAPLLTLALEVVGENSPEAIEAGRRIGIAWSLIGLVRALPFHLRSRRQYLPRELTRRHAVNMTDLLEIRPSHGLNDVIRELSELAATELAAARSLRAAIGRQATPILIQAHFAELYLRRLSAFGFNPFDPRLATAPPMVAWRLALRRLSGRY